MSALLVGAAVALGTSILFPVTARWCWAAAGLLTAAWTAAVAGPLTGGPLLLSVVAATVLEPPFRPETHGFNDLVARIAALAIGVSGGVLVVIRVLQSDLAADLPVFLLVLMATAVGAHLIFQPERAEQARAARLGIVLAAAAWGAGSHPGLAVPVAAAVLVLLVALAATRPRTA